MIAGARRLPTQHLSVRVPWHDSGWNGTVCAKPGSDTACRSLARIAESKGDTAENKVAGYAFADLAPAELPPCVEERAELVERCGLGSQPVRETELSCDSAWIQELANQPLMIDNFFGAVRREESLCFFHAKDAPLSSSSARVIVGVGLVRSVGEHLDYEYTTTIEQAPLRGVLWERNVEHPIRPGFKDGFLFPYQQASASLRTRINSPSLCARKR